MADSLETTRKDYHRANLIFSQLPASPSALLEEWLESAKECDPEDYNAMVLSTRALSQGANSRVVLLRGIEEGTIRFFTNYESTKGREIAAHPHVSCLFFWPQLERQVRIKGSARRSEEEVSNLYFDSRPRSSQIGAWASKQSQEGTELELEGRLAQLTEKFKEAEITRPPFWGALILNQSNTSFGKDVLADCISAIAIVGPNQRKRGRSIESIHKRCS